MDRRFDCKALEAFMKEHDLGVDDLFFVIHLGAEQIAKNPNYPAATRRFWAQRAEECRDLWHNTSREGDDLHFRGPGK